MMPRVVRWIFVVAMMALGAGVVSAQEFPNRPIRIVTSPPGGSSDLIARLIAQGLIERAGWQVIVDHRPSGFIQGEYLLKAPPDGYSLLITASSFVIGPLVRKAPYDVVNDFSPIGAVASSPSVLVVHPSLPVKTVKELIVLAKATPGQLNYSSSSAGATQHLAAELFKAMAGVDIVHIPYKGAGPALVGLLTGEAQLMFATAGSAAPHTRSGRLRAVAVTSAQPSPLVAGLPPIAATVPGYEAIAIWGVFARGKTPEAIVTRLNQEIARVLTSTEVKEKFLSAEVEAITSSPQELAAIVKSEIAKWGKILIAAGISPK